jgi:hypothetical protein
MAYHVWETELAPQTGTRHIQGYVRFETRKRMETVKRLFGQPGMHLERPQGTEGDNQKYCSKSRNVGPYDEQGECIASLSQGHRTDLEEVSAAVLAGTTLAEIAQKYPTTFVRNFRGLQTLWEITRPPPAIERVVSVILLWGPTGTGKTHRCLHTYPGLYSVKPGRDPWGSYRGEKEILFDEFDYEKWTIQDMNRYTDKWRCFLDARYNDKYAEWQTVMICANSNPVSWYQNAPNLLFDAFKRRIAGRTWYVDAQEPTLSEIMETPSTIPLQT